MKIEIKKADVVRALQEERVLEAGAWYGNMPSGREADTIGDKPCVCAVGSVLSRALAQTQDAFQIANAANAAVKRSDGPGYYAVDTPSAIGGHLDAGRYIAALSCFFEKTVRAQPDGSYVATDATRRATIAFVRQHFPKTIIVDIDGAKPRRGVKVVSK